MPRSVSGVMPRHSGAPVAAFCRRECDRAARAVPFLSGQGGCTMHCGGIGQHLDVWGATSSLQA
eukprot:7631198-Lingulodinium_polyedra.AAC.1